MLFRGANTKSKRKQNGRDGVQWPLEIGGNRIGTRYDLLYYKTIQQFSTVCVRVCACGLLSVIFSTPRPSTSHWIVMNNFCRGHFSAPFEEPKNKNRSKARNDGGETVSCVHSVSVDQRSSTIVLQAASKQRANPVTMKWNKTTTLNVSSAVTLFPELWGNHHHRHVT